MLSCLPLLQGGGEEKSCTQFASSGVVKENEKEKESVE
jgi:hypothetical protein